MNRKVYIPTHTKIIMDRKDKDIEIPVKPLCSKCGSGQVYLRLRTMDKVCRMCLNIEKLKIEVKQ